MPPFALGAALPLRALPLPFPFLVGSSLPMRGWKALHPGIGFGLQRLLVQGEGWANLQPLALLGHCLPFHTWLQTRGRHTEVDVGGEVEDEAFGAF